MTPPRWPTVLFDFDGTLADTIPLIVESYRHTLAVSGLPAVIDREIRGWIGRPLLPVFEERYPGRGEELTATYRGWNLAHHDELIAPVEGIGGVLEALRGAGVPIAVVSSKKAETVRLGLRAVGLDELISVAAGMDETSRHKPDPEPLLYAAAALGVEAGGCAYVGDAGVDIAAARAAGMGAVGVTWGAASRAELEAARPDALADTVADLRDILRV